MLESKVGQLTEILNAIDAKLGQFLALQQRPTPNDDLNETIIAATPELEPEPKPKVEVEFEAEVEVEVEVEPEAPAPVAKKAAPRRRGRPPKIAVVEPEPEPEDDDDDEFDNTTATADDDAEDFDAEDDDDAAPDLGLDFDEEPTPELTLDGIKKVARWVQANCPQGNMVVEECRVQIGKDWNFKNLPAEHFEGIMLAFSEHDAVKAQGKTRRDLYAIAHGG